MNKFFDITSRQTDIARNIFTCVKNELVPLYDYETFYLKEKNRPLVFSCYQFHNEWPKIVSKSFIPWDMDQQWFFIRENTTKGWIANNKGYIISYDGKDFILKQIITETTDDCFEYKQQKWVHCKTNKKLFYTTGCESTIHEDVEIVSCKKVTDKLNMNGIHWSNTNNSEQLYP